MTNETTTTEITLFKEYELLFTEKKVSDILSDAFFAKFQTAIWQFRNEVFPETEDGRKRARQLSRSLASNVKIAIFEKGFDALIKQKELDNKAALEEIKSLKAAKTRFISACEVVQKEITKIDDDFKKRVDAQIGLMKSHIKQYQSMSELSDAKEAVVASFEEFEWEEAKKDAGKLLGEIRDKLIMQEGVIANLERERAERQRIEAEREQERLVREREKQEAIIREQAERVAQGKEIELPPIPTPEPIAPTTPQQQSYAMQAPAKIENNYKIVFDLETTGVNNKTDSIVQLAALVFDEDFNEVDRLNVLIQQDREMTNDEILTRVHGKTYAMCQEHGIPLAEAITRFKSMLEGCGHVIGHNIIKFDIPFLTGIAEKIGLYFGINKDIKILDTLVLYRNIAKCPPTQEQKKADRVGYKDPSLTEAYNYVFGKDFENAHDAFGDIKATAEIYKNLVMTNRKVVAIIESMGLSNDQARLIADRLRLEDLTAYSQADIVSVVSDNKRLKIILPLIEDSFLEMEELVNEFSYLLINTDDKNHQEFKDKSQNIINRQRSALSAIQRNKKIL